MQEVHKLLYMIMYIVILIFNITKLEKEKMQYVFKIKEVVKKSKLMLLKVTKM